MRLHSRVTTKSRKPADVKKISNENNPKKLIEIELERLKIYCDADFKSSKSFLQKSLRSASVYQL